MTKRFTLNQQWVCRMVIFIAGIFMFGQLNAQTPTLGTYMNTTVVAARNATITPSAAPTNVVRANAYTSTSFEGILTVNPTTGVVTVTNAMHAGTYAVTVRGFGPISSVTASFTLTVTNPNCSSGGFSSLPSVPVGNGSQMAVAADFNNDGIQDLANASANTNSISVRAGTGTGTFTGTTELAVGTAPRYLAVGDFNRDGFQDIVNSNVSSANFSVSLNDGSGGFLASTAFATASFPTGVSIGDFNNDNFDDLVIGTSGGTMQVHLGNGLGSFTALASVATGAGAIWTIAVGDFNEDGFQDLAFTAMTPNQVFIRLGNGTGTFSGTTNIAVSPMPEVILLGDFNNDDNQDFAVSSVGGFSVSVRYGDGAGNFTGTTEVAMPGGNIGLAVGDFNGDGNEDVAATVSTQVHIRLGDGAGNFPGTNTVFLVSNSARRIAVGDFNGDNIQDIAVPVAGNQISMHMGVASDINVTGNAVNIVDGDVTPSTTDHTSFGAACSGSLVRTFTIQNTGTAQLSVSSVTVSGTNATDFMVTTSPAATVNAAASTTFQVTFTAGGPGLRTATITVNNGDCNEGVYDFAIQGTGVTPVSGTTVVTNVACFATNTGAINLTPNGGTGPYTYNWLPSGPTTEDRVGLAAGTYSVQITDANGCSSTVTATVTQPANLVVTAAAQTNVSNFGGNNGAASINTPTGGVSPYSYNWTPGNPVGDGTTSVTGLTAGTWSCTVTDANTCTSVQTFLITQPGAALHLDGVNDYASATATTGVPVGNANYTIEAWIKPTSFGYRGIVGWGNYGTNSQTNALRLDPSGEIVNYWWFNDLSVNPMNTYGGSPSINLIDGAWHHVAATFDGTTRRMYVDGYLKGQDTPTGHNVPFASNLTIGRTLNNEYFPGSLDEVRIWNRALCQSEIQNNRNCEIATTASGLVANYHFNQGAAAGNNSGVNTLIDASGNNNTCALNNFALSGAASNWIGPGGVISGVSCGAFVAPSVTITLASQTNVSCNAGSNGAASVTAAGGSDFIYDWAPGNPAGDGTASVTGLTAGSWTVTVTNGCSGTGSLVITITQPTAPVSGTTVVTNVACFGGTNGAINLTPTGGTAPYTFNWLPSGPATEDRTGLVAGTYSVQITDANGCTGTVTATVTQPALPVTGTTVRTNVSCFGGNTGAINLTPTGGTGPYTFNWLPSGPTTEDRTGLVAGTYSVQITDVNGCVGTVTALITQPTSPVSGTTVVTNVSCFGGSNGAINLTPTGGTGPYTFNWLPSGPTTEDRTGLVAGTYSVQITDVNGCASTVTVTVTQPISPVSGSTVRTNVSCFGGSNGAINLTPTGGTGPYTFNWLPSGPTTEDRTGLVAGTYSVQITDVNGCVGTVTALITQPTAPVSGTTVVTNVSCFGGSNGAINLTPTGGTAPYTFSWLPSGPTTEDRTGLVAGTYTVIITDVNSCTGTVTVAVTQPTSPVSGTTVVTNVACFGGNTGAINLTPTGGTGPYTFNWLPSGPTTEDRTNLVAGTYSVQITDVNGCVSTVTASVTQPTSPVSGTTVVTNVSCAGGNNGAINLTPNGGTGPYTFNWLPSGPTTEDRTALAAGTYSVQITDANGCQSTVTATVTAPSPMMIMPMMQTSVSCFGGSNGSITTFVMGGTPGYTFDWSPGSPAGDGTGSVSGLTAGTWSVFVTDANGCSSSAAFTVTEPTAISLSTSQTDVSCNGGNDGAATVTASGGTGGFTYSWSTGGTAATETGLSIGNYSVVVTDANGCSASASVSITEPSAITLSTSQNDVSCNGGNDGDATVTATGGTGGFTYSWNTGGTAATETGLTTGNYFVLVTDANGCSTSASVSITEPSVITLSTSQNNPLCYGGIGDVTVTATGGAGGYTYAWNTGGTAATETGLSAGNYSVDVTDASGCSASAGVTIVEPSEIAWIPVQSEPSCNGGNDGNATVYPSGGTGPFTFLWDSGNTTATDTGLTAGNYSVIITDANFCTTTASVTIFEPAVLIATVSSVVNPMSCGGTDGSIDITIGGGVMYYSTVWSNSATSEDLTNIAAGVYSATITDANGCTTTVSATISDPNAPAVTLSLPMDTACGSTPGTIVLSGETPVGGTWSGNNVSGNTFDPFNAGVGVHFITYTFTDANGCTGNATDSVYVDLCMGMETATAAATWNAFPNPTSGLFTLSTNGELNGDVIVEVYSAEGKLIRSSNEQSSVITIDMTNEPVGTYFIRITSNETVSVQRVMKI